MIGETALSTRTKCDECRIRTATRETPAGVFCDACEPDAPHAANDDALGASCTLPLCSHCQSDPVFFRVKEGDLCSACFAISNSVASTPQDAKVTAAAPSALSHAAVAVTPPSKEPEVLALLFCRPVRRSSERAGFGATDSVLSNENTKGRWSPGREDMETSGPALFAADEASEDVETDSSVPWSPPCRGINGDLGPTLLPAPFGVSNLACDALVLHRGGSATSSSGTLAQDRPDTNSSSCGGVEGTRAPFGRHGGALDGSSPAQPKNPKAGIKSGPQDSISAGVVEQSTRDNLDGPTGLLSSSATLGPGTTLPQGGSPVTVGAGLVPVSPAVTPIPDSNTPRGVSYGSQGPERPVIGPDHAELSSRLANSCADSGAAGFDPEIEALVSWHEENWVAGKFGAQFVNPVWIGVDLASGPDLCVKYTVTSASFAASDSAENSKSVPESRA